MWKINFSAKNSSKIYHKAEKTSNAISTSLFTFLSIQEANKSLQKINFWVIPFLEHTSYSSYEDFCLSKKLFKLPNHSGQRVRLLKASQILKIFSKTLFILDIVSGQLFSNVAFLWRPGLHEIPFALCDTKNILFLKKIFH